MRFFKIALIILLTVLVIVLAGAAYFFYKVYTLQKISNAPTTTTTEQTTTPVTVDGKTVPATGFTMAVSSLPEGQQAVAKSMGFTDQIVITPTAVVCAQQRIGEDRVAAISAGATPTLTESIALLGCI